MSADKPLQDVFSTVRVPLTDSIQWAPLSYNAGGANQTTSSQCYINSYPEFFTDRSSNQYSSQFDTVVQKRGPIVGGFTQISNATLPTAHSTNAWVNLCISNLDDVFVAAIWDDTSSLIRIIQYKPAAGTSLQIGTIAGASLGDTLYLTELIVAGVPYIGLTYMNAAETTTTGAYAASAAGTFTAASLTVIADVDFPSNIATTHIRGAFIQMDGYTCVITKEGGLYNSDLNSISSWNALGIVQANAYPDQGVGLARYKNLIMAFGEDSIEFFSDTGKPGPASPFGRTDQAFIKFGAMFAKGIINVNDTVYWFAKSSSGTFGLYKIDGFTPTKVSSMRDDLIISEQQNSGLFPELYVFYDRGKQHLISTATTNTDLIRGAITNEWVAEGSQGGGILPNDPFNLTLLDVYAHFLCWDLITGISWLYSQGTSFVFFPLMAMNFASSSSSYKSVTSNITLFSDDVPRYGAGAAAFSNNIFQTTDFTSSSSGATTPYSDLSPSDYSTLSPYLCGVQFNIWDFGTEKRKRIHKLKVIRQQYQQVQSPATLPALWVFYNKHDAGFYMDTASTTGNLTRTFARYKVQSSTTIRTYFNNLGTARKWYFAVLEKSNLPFSIKAVELDISQGTS